MSALFLTPLRLIGPGWSPLALELFSAVSSFLHPTYLSLHLASWPFPVLPRPSCFEFPFWFRSLAQGKAFPAVLELQSKWGLWVSDLPGKGIQMASRHGREAQSLTPEHLQQSLPSSKVTHRKELYVLWLGGLEKDTHVHHTSQEADSSRPYPSACSHLATPRHLAKHKTKQHLDS